MHKHTSDNNDFFFANRNQMLMHHFPVTIQMKMEDLVLEQRDLKGILCKTFLKRMETEMEGVHL